MSRSCFRTSSMGQHIGYIQYLKSGFVCQFLGHELWPSMIRDDRTWGGLEFTQFQAKLKNLNNESSISELQDFKIFLGTVSPGGSPTHWCLYCSLVSPPPPYLKEALPSLIILKGIYISQVVSIFHTFWCSEFFMIIFYFYIYRQYYVYVTDTRSRRLGTQAWVLM